MDKLKIIGGNKLEGQIVISGAKNAALPLICASLLTDEKVTLTNMPKLSDVRAMNKLLLDMGVKVNRLNETEYEYEYLADDVKSYIAPYELVRKMRASYYVLGPLLSRFGYAKVSLPGGCAIGARPMDIHLSAFEQMGAKVTIENGYVLAEGKLKGAEINFSFASVGATCNVIMAATLAEGTTKITNAAKEPEIEDLAILLNAMGAKIEGAGTSVITINGVTKLSGTIHQVIEDRIEAGSYAVAAAITKGKIELINAKAKHLALPLKILQNMGISVEEKENSIIIDATSAHLEAQDVITECFPGFPTDLQAQYLALMTISNGASLITETIFENRFMHVPELKRMGANINVHGHASAIIRGVDELSGAEVMATDLRASFALVLAGLVAKGETTVSRLYHLDRGYERLEEKLQAVGANIRRIKEDEED
ncbi:MAG: UDP-N-acetylglucosamine 1-carboxyvinyltransferase [Alphaproteobacteria bacterium]